MGIKMANKHCSKDMQFCGTIIVTQLKTKEIIKYTSVSELFNQFSIKVSKCVRTKLVYSIRMLYKDETANLIYANVTIGTRTIFGTMRST